MRKFLSQSVLVAAVAALAVAAAGCSQYNGLKAKRTFRDANGMYQSSDYKAASGKYEQVVTLKGPTDCVAGAVTFRCIIQNCVVVSTRSTEKLQLLVTGFRNHFLKVRLDWHQNSPQGDAAAEGFLQALGSQVLR